MSNKLHTTRTPRSKPSTEKATNTSPQQADIENAQLVDLQRTIGNQAVQRMFADGRLTPGSRRFNGLPPVRGTNASKAAPGQVYRSPALQIRHRLGSTNIARLIQRVATWGGDYTTDKYDIVNDTDGKTPIGVDIELRFKPNKHVDAKQIGMSQMVNSIDKGTVLPLNKTIESRSIPKGDPGAGSHLDQLKEFENPLYATGATAKGDSLTSTPTNDQWGQHGHRFKDEAGKLKEKDALLKDTPKLPGRGANASQIFESTALASEGTQQGTFYGSVQWGWQTDGSGSFSKLPLTVISNDVPSDTFAAATELWNKGKTSTGAETMDLPTAQGKYTNSSRIWLVSDPSKYKSTIMSKLAKNTRVEVTDKGDEQRFNKTVDLYKWWKVTAVSGDAIGQVGWVMQHFLSDAKTE